MSRIYDKAVLGANGWECDATPNIMSAYIALDSSGNPVGLVGPDGNLFMEFVDVGGSSASATVEV